MMKYYFRILLLLIGQNVSSQDQSLNPTLWLKQVDNVRDNGLNETYFNFNPIFSITQPKDFAYKDLNFGTYSLFIAMKSEIEEPVEIVDIHGNSKEKVIISNKQILGSTETKYSQVDAKKGFILTYLVNQLGRRSKKANLHLKNLSRTNTEAGFRTDLLELLFYPRKVTDSEKQKIETYLSLKYGISLIGIVDYVNYDGFKIWDSKANEFYNTRVTGIGKDEAFGLTQKQSGNAQKDGLFIGFGNIESSNELNDYKVNDQTFLMWGDNTASLKFLKDKENLSPLQKMSRIWKMQNTSSSTNHDDFTQVLIDKETFSIVEDSLSLPSKKGSKELVWLVIDRNCATDFDYHNADYYLSKDRNDGKLVFDQVYWDTDRSGSDTFTFVKGPDFFVDYLSKEAECDADSKGEVKLKIIGGKAPYTIAYKSDNSKTFTISDNALLLSEMEANRYEFSVTDSMHRLQRDTLVVNNLKGISVQLDKQYTLDVNNSVLVTPLVDNPAKEKLQFQWKLEGVTQSTEEAYRATEEGNYSLHISNQLGCQTELKFIVESKTKPISNTEDWSIFPNPSPINDEFSIQFNLKTTSEVSVAFFDISNRLIKTKNLGLIKDEIYKDSLSSTGTFLVVMTINGQSTSTKLIIQ